MEETISFVSYLPSGYYYPLALLGIILVGLHLYIENTRAVKLSRKVPGPLRLPIIGNSYLALGVHPKDVLTKLLEYDVYGHVVRASMGTKVIFFILHPRDFEVILSNPIHNEKPFDYRFFEPWLGDGLLINNGEKWRTHRKIIAPTFHLNILKSFVPMFYENSKELVDRLRKFVGKEFDCHDYLSAVVVDILLETVMGMRGLKKQNNSYEYAAAVMKMCDIIHQRQYNIHLRPQFLFNFSSFAKRQKKLLGIIHGLSNNVIEAKKQAYKRNIKIPCEKTAAETVQPIKREITGEGETGKSTLHYVRDDLDDIDENDVGEKKRLAFLDFMLELSRNGGQLTDEEVKEEVDTIMFEGHDTVSAASSFALTMLGIHQDVQDRVYEELNEIFKGSDRQCTFQDTLEMKYLERVILETLRLFPPVPGIGRQLGEDVRLATIDAVLPKNTTALIGIYKAHRLPEYYPNPDQFNPDNFLPERMQRRHYYAFIPFSAGPRSCVGRKYALLKLKVLLSTILRNYRILSDHQEKDFRLKVDIILKRADGFRVKIEPRNKSE